MDFDSIQNQFQGANYFLLVRFEISSTLQKKRYKSYAKKQKQYDVVIKYFTVQVFMEKLMFNTNKQLKFTILQLKDYEIL